MPLDVFVTGAILYLKKLTLKILHFPLEKILCLLSSFKNILLYFMMMVLTLDFDLIFVEYGILKV